MAPVNANPEISTSQENLMKLKEADKRKHEGGQKTNNSKSQNSSAINKTGSLNQSNRNVKKPFAENPLPPQPAGTSQQHRKQDLAPKTPEMKDEFYVREFAKDNGHEFCVRMARLILPKWDPSGLPAFALEGPNARYYGGVKLPTRNIVVTCQVFDDDERDANKVLKGFIIKDIIGYKPKMIEMPTGKGSGKLPRTMIVVKSLEDKAKLLATHQKRVMKMKSYYNIRILSDSKDNRFKGKIYVPHLLENGREDFLMGLELLKEEGEFPELNIDLEEDVDIFMRRNKTGEMEPTGTVTIRFNTAEVIKVIQYGTEDIEVKEFLEEPLRCQICHQFDHTSNTCGGRPTCYMCGEAEHDSEIKCKGIFCVNCLGTDHHSYHNDCPMKLFMIELARYCRMYDVSRDDVKRFMREVTEAYFTELDAATGRTDKIEVRQRWMNTFKIVNVFKVPQDVGEKRKQALEKIIKPGIARTFLDSIGQRFSDTFKKWCAITRPRELTRSESLGNVDSRSRSRRPSFGSQLQLNQKNNKTRDSSVQSRLQNQGRIGNGLNRVPSTTSVNSLTSVQESQYLEDDLGMVIDDNELNMVSITSASSTQSPPLKNRKLGSGKRDKNNPENEMQCDENNANNLDNSEAAFPLLGASNRDIV